MANQASKGFTLLLAIASSLQCRNCNAFQQRPSTSLSEFHHYSRLRRKYSNRFVYNDSLTSKTSSSVVETFFSKVSSQQKTATSLGAFLPMSTLASSYLASAPVFGSIAVLAFVIVIHEAGHFLVARSLGITVAEFSVGVGPRIAGFRTSQQQNDGIEFNLRAIPLGGYVRFPENYNATLVMQMEIEADEQRQAFQSQQQRKKKRRNQTTSKIPNSSVHTVTSNNSGFFSFMKKKEKQVALETPKNHHFSWWNGLSAPKKKNPDPIQLPEKVLVDYYDDPNLLQNRPWVQRAMVLVAGVVFNILLAFTCYFGELTVGNGLPRLVFDNGAVVSASPRVDGASSGLLSRGDIIVAVNGLPLVTPPNANVAQDAITKFIAGVRSTTPGESLHLSVLKNSGDKMSPTFVDVKPQHLPDGGPMSIGVMLAPNYLRTDRIHAANVVDAISKAGGAVYDLTAETARTLFLYLTNIGRSTATGQSISGPLGVIRMGSDVISTNDFSAVVAFAAAISINFAVVNSLPLPALDGGQLAFVLAEAVTGKKIDQRLQEGINATALLLLLVLTFSFTIGDLGR